MRFFVLFIASIIAVVALGFFRPPNIDETPNELKISVYEYFPEDFMITELVQLKPGEPVKCHLNSSDLSNINVVFEYDGVIQVYADDIQLSVSRTESEIRATTVDEIHYGYDVHINGDGVITFFPIGIQRGRFMWDEKIESAKHEIGHEYYATVRAFADPFLTEPTETVTLKFVRKSLWGQFTIELVE